MARTEVKITNGGMEAMVSPRAAKVYERHGWTVVDDGSSETEAQEMSSDAFQEAPPAEAEQSKKTTSRKAE